MAGALIAATPLTACSNGEANEPESGLPDETTETSPTGTPSDEPTPPTLPSDIDSTSPADAEAFARYVVEVINYAKRTLDVAPLRQIFASDCQICVNGIENTQSLANEGARIEGGLWNVTFLRYVPERPLNEPLIDIVIKVDEERVFHPGSSKPEINKGFQDNYAWTLEFTKPGGWTLADWTFTE